MDGDEMVRRLALAEITVAEVARALVHVGFVDVAVRAAIRYLRAYPDVLEQPIYRDVARAIDRAREGR